MKDFRSFIKQLAIVEIKEPTLYDLYVESKIPEFSDFLKLMREVNSVSSDIVDPQIKKDITVVEAALIECYVDKNAAKNVIKLMSKRYSKPSVTSVENFNLGDRDKLIGFLDTLSFEESQLENFREKYLKPPTAAQVLASQSASLTTPMTPFLDTCQNSAHCTQIASVCTFDIDREAYNRWRNRNHNQRQHSIHENEDYVEVLLRIDKAKMQRLSPALLKCVASKIHFVPVIKSTRRSSKSHNLSSNAVANINTDPSLGDCSYLDTCYKWDNCRYLHYYTLLPNEALKAQQESCREFNEKIKEVERTKYFAWGETLSWNTRDIVPPQWVKCNIFHIDMSMFGKFAVIIADPAWSIHMELDFDQFEDETVQKIPVQSLQDEGVFFLWVTGRVYEVGKKCLQNWGYEIVNEVVWIKINQMSRTICTGRTGHWLNHSKEHVLVGVKGNPTWLQKSIDVDLIVASAREASRKPDELYGIAERLVGVHARKLELFGRSHNTRPGWFTLGDQLEGVSIHEQVVLEKYQKWASSGESNRRPEFTGKKGFSH